MLNLSKELLVDTFGFSTINHNYRVSGIGKESSSTTLVSPNENVIVILELEKTSEDLFGSVDKYNSKIFLVDKRSVSLEVYPKSMQEFKNLLNLLQPLNN